MFVCVRVRMFVCVCVYLYLSFPSLRASHMAKCEDLHGDRTHYELRRQYHCAAYRALMAVISCTQNKIQFYHGFLFKEDLNKVSGREGGWEGGGRSEAGTGFSFVHCMLSLTSGSDSMGKLGGFGKEISIRNRI